MKAIGCLCVLALVLGCSSESGEEIFDSIPSEVTADLAADIVLDAQAVDSRSDDLGFDFVETELPSDADAQDTVVPIPDPLYSVSGHSILDESGHTLFLRGVNLSGAAKAAPGHLIDVDDALIAELLKDGVNSVRYLVFWSGVQPNSADEIDGDYLEAVRERMQRLADAGIYIVVDFHQDLWGRPFAQHGAPDWACEESMKEGFESRSPWWSNYLTDQVSGCFDAFWDSLEMQQVYGDMASQLAQVVCDNPMIVGFDPMNEPWPGSALDDPNFDNDVLLPFYLNVFEKIDAQCPGRLLFVEPSGAFTFGLADAMEIPEAMRDRIVVAPHYYPPEVHESTGAGYGADDDAKAALYADLEGDWGAYLEQDVPLWVGEYGGITDVPNIERYMIDLHSWFLEHNVQSALWDHSKGDGGFAFLNAAGELKTVFEPVFQTPVPTRMPSPPTAHWASFENHTASIEVQCSPGKFITWLCPGPTCKCHPLMPTLVKEEDAPTGFVSFQCVKEGTVEMTCGQGLTLVQDGETQAVIYLAVDASPSEQQGANELQEHLLTATGVTLPIVSEAPVDGIPMIVLGRNDVAASLGVAPTDELLGEQGYTIRTVQNHVVIAGTAAAGTLYGVYRFLEEYVGVRWYAPGVENTPTIQTLELPPIDRTVQPAFEFRNTSYEWPGGDEEFVKHQLDNGGNNLEDDPFGVEQAHDGRAHSYFWYVSPEEFFDEHPEYFSEIGGVRIKDETQLCLTNPDVLDIVTERMLQRMADKPHVRQHNFSQKDRYNYCQCDKCTAMNEKYKTAGGTQFWFVNELAKRTSQVYPDKLIGTLAYMYTEEPPEDLEMHPNVAVWLCHMYPSCDSHPVATCPENADYKRRAEAWAKLVDHLYIWHYIVDFTHYYNPFPNFRAMVADMRFYKDIGVEGIYLQGMGNSGGGGEFSLLRPYYGMQLLWDPRQDPDAIREEFLKGYYLSAWEPIRDYIEMLLDEVTDKNIHMHLYTNPGQGYLSDEIMTQADTYFDEAEALAAEDEELLERVKVARMPLTYARLFPRNGYEIVQTTLKWIGGLVSGAELMDFMNRMTAHGFKAVRETGGDPELLLLLYSILGDDLEVVPLDNGILKVEVVPNLGGRVLRIIHLESDECITASNRIPNLFFPFAGGVEDRIGGAFEAYGWVEPTKIEEVTETQIVLSQSTLNNYGILRTVTLLPGESSVTFETTVTNATDSSREDRFRFHAEFDLGDLWNTEVEFTNLAGETIVQEMAPIIAGQREGIHYYDEQAPNGQWTFTGTKGLEVTQTFDNDAYEYAWLYSYPETLNELEAEIWSPKLYFEAGESKTFSHTLTIQ